MSEYTWQALIREMFDAGNTRFDAIISEPPPAPSRSFIARVRRIRASHCDEIQENEAHSFAAFARVVSKHGGYILLLIAAFMFEEWFIAFYRVGFDVMTFPFLVL